MVNCPLLAVGVFLAMFSLRKAIARLSPSMPPALRTFGRAMFRVLPVIVVGLGIAGAFLPGVFPEMAVGVKIVLGLIAGAFCNLGYKFVKQLAEKAGVSLPDELPDDAAR
jgi:hypothetical protein